MKAIFSKLVISACFVTMLAACGGGGGDDSSSSSSFTVSTNSGIGGSITPSNVTVPEGETTDITITADSGFTIETVTGDCSGILNGDTYTAGPISGNCTVTATFIATTPSPRMAVWDDPDATWDNVVWQ